MRVAWMLAALATTPVAAARSTSGSSSTECWKKRVDRAHRIADAAAGTVAFAMVDPDGRSWGVRDRRSFPSASLLKTTLMVAYLRLPSVRSRALTATERNLLAQMIRRSDNDATNALVGRLPATSVTGAARASGQRAFVYRLPIWGLSGTGAADQARLYVNLDSVVPRRHRHFARSLLRTVIPSQRWGIPEVAPNGWSMMFKGGWGSGTGRITGQAARLERDGQVWTVAVLTERNPSHDAGVATIRRVSAALLGAGPC